MEKRITVPYFSQYRDLQDKYFALTSCGMVSLYMVLQYFQKKNTIELSQKVEEMVTIGRETPHGYLPGVGWIHEYFVTIAKGFGLDSYRKEKIESFEEIIASLEANNPVIVSVERRCLSIVSLHMIVLIGFKNENNEIQGFYYHDPAALEEKDGANRFCDRDSFLHFWRAKAIFFSEKH